MATLSTTTKTLADWAKEMDPDGNVAVVAELLSQTNEILMDCQFREGNLVTGEQATVRTGLPDVYYRALNEPIAPSKSTSVQITEACSMLEARSEVDVKLANLGGNREASRAQEARAFIEAMNQEQASTLFYGNPSTDPKKHLGLAPRYSDLSAGNAANILDAGGMGSDNQSIYLVVWGENTVYCPFPQGSKAGLDQKDLGEMTTFDTAGKRMQVFAEMYNWDSGLMVKDWRYVVRIANIDVSDLKARTGTQAIAAATNILDLMDDAITQIPNINMGKSCFYLNRGTMSGLRKMAKDTASSVLANQAGLDQFGLPHRWTDFNGVPLRLCDALLKTESRVT